MMNGLQSYKRFSLSLLAMVLVVCFAFPSAVYASPIWARAAESNNDSFDTLTAILSVSTGENTGETNGTDDTIGDDSIIGPEGTLADIVDSEATYTIDDQTSYIVRENDTLASIAELFDLKKSTITLANNLSANVTLKLGQKLIIPPGDGVMHIVKKGETLKSIAKTYKGDADEIADFNYLLDSSQLIAGQKIFIPGGIVTIPAPIKGGKVSRTNGPATLGISFIKPVTGKRTSSFGMRGGHMHEGIDFGIAVGTPIYASASGVVSARAGYNGGYGNLIVIKHGQSIETRYAHLSSIVVATGTSVNQGDLIGYSGNTGRSTGPHLHFEIRQNGRALNPANYLPK
jgi:murein DD-endopeptidase MepM/ murein hydrolase activator NlpD